jgi:hypothetical protein
MLVFDRRGGIRGARLEFGLPIVAATEVKGGRRALHRSGSPRNHPRIAGLVL